MKMGQVSPKNITILEILETCEEESRDFDKLPSNSVIDIQIPTLQKSLSYENLGTPQDMRKIRAQSSVLKSHVMCEFSALNQKISSLSENFEKAVNDMKIHNRNVDLLHKNIKILENELAQKNEIIKSLTEIQSTVCDSLSAGRNDQIISDQQQQQQQQSQQMLEHSQQTMYEQQQHECQQQMQQNQCTQNIQLSQQQQQQQQHSIKKGSNNK